MRRAVLAVVVAVVLAPMLAKAECPEPAPGANPLSDRPYAEDSSVRKPCPDTNIDFNEPPDPHPWRTMGVAGMGSGASVLGIGGLLWLAGALTPDPGSKSFELDAAIVFGAVGGALFLAGAGIVIYDHVSVPVVAPSPDNRGAQIVFTGRF